MIPIILDELSNVVESPVQSLGAGEGPHHFLMQHAHELRRDSTRPQPRL